jgi:hypothetical protein
MTYTPETTPGTKKPKRDWYEKWSIGLLALTFVAASFAAAFTGHLASIAKDTEETQLKAYVGVVGIGLQCGTCDQANWSPGQPLLADKDAVLILSQNGGKTPAYDTVAGVGWYPTTHGGQLPADFAFPDHKRDPTMRSIDSRSELLPGQQMTHSEKFGADDVTDVWRARRKDIDLFLYGHIDYRDVFGKCHTTPFCGRYEPEISPIAGIRVWTHNLIQ